MQFPQGSVFDRNLIRAPILLYRCAVKTFFHLHLYLWASVYALQRILNLSIISWCFVTFLVKCKTILEMGKVEYSRILCDVNVNFETKLFNFIQVVYSDTMNSLIFYYHRWELFIVINNTWSVEMLNMKWSNSKWMSYLKEWMPVQLEKISF